MKKAWVICIAVILFTGWAKAIEFEYNLLTNHHFDSCKISEKYENKVAYCGKSINNKMFGIKLNDNENQLRLFGGYNSIGKPMYGFTVNVVGPIIVGAYQQDINEFKKLGLQIPLALPGGIIPILGAELDKHYKNIKVFTIITPPISTIGIGVGF